jgi:hypothetical protein
LETFKKASAFIDVDQFQRDEKLEYYKAASLVGHWMSGSTTQKRLWMIYKSRYTMSSLSLTNLKKLTRL